MGERTGYAPGAFSWVDLGTSDGDGAKVFYGGLLGWEFEDMPVPDSPPYSMATIGGRRVAAVYAKRDEQLSPAWLSYVNVEDADATAARAAEHGGAVMSEPFEVLQAGRMAVLQDPAGAIFAIWQARATIGAELVNAAGALCINQLNTTGPEAAQRFYGDLFGWTFESVAAGDRPYWGISNGGRLNGGMMRAEPPQWLVYFTSADLDSSIANVAALGGRVGTGPVPIPGGRIAVATDPQGAVFALFEGRVDD